MSRRTGTVRRLAATGSTEPGSGGGPVLAGELGMPATSWPLQSYLELGALPTAVPCARLHTRLVLGEWGLQILTETVELIVSELVTNGVVASERLTASRYAGRWAPGTPPVRLWLCSDRTHVVIQAWDSNDQMPVRQDAALEAESGRGLQLVEAVSEDWGAFRPDSSTGKVVWAAATGDSS